MNAPIANLTNQIIWDSIARDDDVDLLRIRIAAGTNVQERMGPGPMLSSVALAAKHGALKVARLLLEAGVSGMAPIGSGVDCDPLALAARAGHREMCALLLRHHAQFNPEAMAAWREFNQANHLEGMSSLEEATRNAEVNARRALQHAFEFGRIDVVLLLQAAGVDARRNDDWKAPLFYAKNGAIMVAYLEAEAPAVRALAQEEALALAAFVANHGDLVLARILLEREQGEALRAVSEQPYAHAADLRAFLNAYSARAAAEAQLKLPPGPFGTTQRS